MLFVRSLGTLTIKPLAGTENATYPFWSPDSRFVAFFAPGKLKKVQVTGGGPPSVVCDAASGRGGTWSSDNVILFAPSTSGGLERVAATGGTPAPATTIDSARGETTHRWPHFLPDGRHFLYFAPSNGQRPSEVKAGALDSRDATLVVAVESAAAFASGHLFFWRDGGVVAQPFDPETRQVHGDPLLVAQQVGQNLGYASFSVSPTGVLVYARGSVRPTSRLTWIDRAGKALDTVGEPGDYWNVALAPDERRAAVALQTGTPENRDIWLIDLARSVSSRLTVDPANEVLPTWSPDGAHIVFSSNRAATGIYRKASSGSGQEELLMKADEGTAQVIDWSRDGRFLIYFGTYPKNGFDLWILPLAGDKKPFPFLQTGFNEDNGAFAPDVKWIAYTSNESGRDEVYVQPFPATGGRYQISKSGGTQPLWRGDGRELFFLTPDGTMMAASINATHGFEAGIAQPLFASGVASTVNRRQYAVTRDGKRFLVIVAQQRSSPTPLTVVVNWPAAVRQ
jgi:Tol biopolymer transport system component